MDSKTLIKALKTAVREVIKEELTEILREGLQSTITEIKQPFVIVPMQSKPGGPVSLALTPYMPYAEEDTVSIKKNNIVAEVNPKTEIGNSYNQHLGSGIIQAKKPKLIID
jgi:hypothetical protein